jgi:hypothetical protein
MNRPLAQVRDRQFFRFNTDTGQFIPDKDWDQFEGCQQCKGRAMIDETTDGDLVCQVCKATLPRPSS